MPNINLLNAIKKINAHEGPLTEQLVIRTAKRALNHYRREWITPETSELAEAIYTMGLNEFAEAPLLGRNLDSTLTAKGIEWLNRTIFKKNGERRESKDALCFGEREARIVKNFSHFTFDGFVLERHAYGHGEYEQTWRVHAKNGDSFAYLCTKGPHNYNGTIEIFN